MTASRLPGSARQDAHVVRRVAQLRSHEVTADADDGQRLVREFIDCAAERMAVGEERMGQRLGHDDLGAMLRRPGVGSDLIRAEIASGHERYAEGAQALLVEADLARRNLRPGGIRVARQPGGSAIVGQRLARGDGGGSDIG
jgi:hypothetical protein